MLKVIAQAERLATHSWEYGSLSLALIDWFNPDISVFSPGAFPKEEFPLLDINTTQALAYAKPLIRLNSSTLIDGDGKLGVLDIQKSAVLTLILVRCRRRSGVPWYRCSPHRGNDPVV